MQRSPESFVSRICAMSGVLLSLLLVSCSNSDPIESGETLTEGDSWPGFSYTFDSLPTFSARNSSTACTATGSTINIAKQNYGQQCALPRVDCDPIGGEWVCSSEVISGVSNTSSVPVSPPVFINTDTNSSGQPVDPASWNMPEVYQKPGYELVFSDEFNSHQIDTARWNTQLRWDGEFNGSWHEYRIVNGEKQFYVNILSDDPEHQAQVVPAYNPFVFDGSRLAIRASVNPFLETIAPTGPEQIGRDINYGRLDPLLKRQPFLSGVLSTHGKFSRKYGYFEARIKIPSHAGTFPAFWLFHQRERWQDTRRSEIDIMENLGHATQYVYNSFHYFDNVSISYPGDANFLRPEPNGQITGGDFSDDYRVYAVDWSPGSVIWYIDGEEVSRLENSNVDHEEMYIILNLAIGGNWVNFPVSAGGLGRPDDQRYPTVEEQAASAFGNPQLEIDYVRVYRHVQ